MKDVVLVLDGDIDAAVLGAVEVALATVAPQSPARRPGFPATAPARLASTPQYNSAGILVALAAAAPADAVTLGVTEKDLCLPMLSFVFGHAQLGGRVAVVSLARLRQEFYGLPPDAGLLQERAAKEALHEVGHACGLVHCTDSTCAMSLSTGVEQVDAKQAMYCGSCRALLSEKAAAARGEEVEP